MQDTSDPGNAARVIAENVYFAFWRHAATPIHPMKVQTLLAR